VSRTPSRPRVAAFAVLAVGALGASAIAGTDRTDERRLVAKRFARAWERNDLGAMHALLSPAAQRRASRRRLERTYREAAATATLRSVDTGRPVRAGAGVYRVPVVARTAAFGDLRSEIRLPVSGEGEQAGVDWSARLAFPGLRRGEKLSRETRVAPRPASWPATARRSPRGPSAPPAPARPRRRSSARSGRSRPSAPASTSAAASLPAPASG